MNYLRSLFLFAPNLGVIFCPPQSIPTVRNSNNTYYPISKGKIDKLQRMNVTETRPSLGQQLRKGVNFVEFTRIFDFRETRD